MVNTRSTDIGVDERQGIGPRAGRRLTVEIVVQDRAHRAIGTGMATRPHRRYHHGIAVLVGSRTAVIIAEASMRSNRAMPFVHETQNKRSGRMVEHRRNRCTPAQADTPEWFDEIARSDFFVARCGSIIALP